jgi:hypothetical protein
MSVRFSDEQLEWLRKKAELTGRSVGEIVRDQVDSARLDFSEKPWMKLAGSVKGLPRDLSSRKGYSRK